VQKNLTQDEAVSRFAEFRAKARNEIARLTESTQAARAMNENLVSEATRWQEEKAALLAHIEQLKLLQVQRAASAFSYHHIASPHRLGLIKWLLWPSFAKLCCLFKLCQLRCVRC